jgi:CheY-like chemotaxis protein
VSLIVRNQRIYEPITRLNIRSLQFPCASSIRITEDSSLINNVKLKFPTFEVGFSAKISRMTLYLYQLEFTDLQLEEFQKINKYLWDRYKESIVGVLKLEKDAPTTAVHTAIFSKPKIEAPQFKAKILLADDEILFTDLLSRFLQQKGYHCFAVNEAREILDRAIRYKPDLIILDLKMPDYDGITICRRLKRNPATVQIPVIMMTGSNIKDDIIESKEAGAQDYVLKSADLDLELLLKRIENILKT